MENFLKAAVFDALVLARLAMRGGPKRALKVVRDIRSVRRSPLFSREQYVNQRSDLAGLPDPARHYVLYGAAEGLDPSSGFSSWSYLADNPDVAAQGLNPLAHFERTGRQEGRLADPEGGGALRQWPLAISRSPFTDFPAGSSRPDDAVISEARIGRDYLTRHGLLGGSPDFTGATRAVSAIAEGVLPAMAEQPEVSIVIPVHGQLAYTLNALHSLSAHATRRPFEIIVVDDASPDQTSAALAGIPGVRQLVNETNQGFLLSANAGAAAARGRFIVLLNNDVRVVAGWLDELIDSFDLFPNAGLVGSKLFYPDGSLQEAGGIVWKDGSAWNYGRGQDPNHPAFCYARQVDYVSGCSIALPAELWRTLGGFDPEFAPAYCEDSDLAFRVRAAGRETWFQPLSRTIHYEGKSSGTDLTAGVKAYQLVNQQKLADRWKPALARHRSPGDRPEFERERQVSRRVLMLDATTPSPGADAGSVTTTKITRLFQLLGYKVVFAPVDNMLFDPALTPPLQRDRVECLYRPYVSSLNDHLATFGRLYDVVHVFRYPVLDRTLPALKQYCSKSKIVFNNMDLHFLRLERQAETEDSERLRRQAAGVRAAELSAMSQADVICSPSSSEVELLGQALPGARVSLMPYIVDVPPESEREPSGRDVLFLGGFRHPPNIDAAVWFAKSVWPQIATRVPGARFLIVGSDPSATVQALGRAPNIIVTGRVDDLEPWFARARVFIAPLRFGAGVKGKIYSAMAHGVPVVSSPIGAEGMGLRNGEEVLEAESPDATAAAVLKLYEDDELWRRLAAAGRRRVSRDHSLEAGEAALRAVLKCVGAPA